MITLRAQNYAKLLFSMGLKDETVNRATNLLQNGNTLMDILQNPVIKFKEKEAVINDLFDKEITGFLKVICMNDAFQLFPMIMESYGDLILENRNIIKAKFIYAVKPEEEQLEEIKKMLCNKYNKTGASLELEEDASLIGGYVLYVGNMEYNKSIKSALTEMKKSLVGR